MNEEEQAVVPLDPIQILRQEFRGHLEQFYTQLTLAPPYHSIEKAVQHLSNTLRTKSAEFQLTLLNNPTNKWEFFQEIFCASGLQKKHRGIILRIARSSSYSGASPATLGFLKLFTEAPQHHDSGQATRQFDSTQASR